MRVYHSSQGYQVTIVSNYIYKLPSGVYCTDTTHNFTTSHNLTLWNDVVHLHFPTTK